MKIFVDRIIICFLVNVILLYHCNSISGERNTLILKHSAIIFVINILRTAPPDIFNFISMFLFNLNDMTVRQRKIINGLVLLLFYCIMRTDEGNSFDKFSL